MYAMNFAVPAIEDITSQDEGGQDVPVLVKDSGKRKGDDDSAKAKKVHLKFHSMHVHEVLLLHFQWDQFLPHVVPRTFYSLK